MTDLARSAGGGWPPPPAPARRLVIALEKLVADDVVIVSPQSGEVPFSSRRRWSVVKVPGDAFYLGAPGRIPVGRLDDIVRQRQVG